MDIYEEIAKAAYELYEKSGRLDGRDVENWLRAESIVKARHVKKEVVTAVKHVEQAAGAVAQKVRAKVKETADVLKTAAKKGVKKASSKKMEP
ncbi:MAG: DUF2934 domain-containing protein [Deltaproteobacteria bacterium]